LNKNEIIPGLIAIALLFVLLFVSVAFYHFHENLSFRDAVFFTVITMSTVGFREVAPLSALGTWFTVFLIIFSIGIFAYAVTTLTRYIVEGVLRNYFKDNKVKKKISRLSDHVIVCGFGRNGKQATSELIDHGVKTIVIEQEEGPLQELRDDEDILYIAGDATKDEVLQYANIERARALITTLPVDADNLFVVLTARELNNSITIISRASNDNSDIKLKRAGADNVIMPDKIGGQRMAKLIAQPDVVEFLDFVMLQSTDSVALEEISCQELADFYINKSIRELDVRNESGANIIGLKREDGSFIVNPLPEVLLSRNDKMFVLGTKKQLGRLRNILGNVHV